MLASKQLGKDVGTSKRQRNKIAVGSFYIYWLIFHFPLLGGRCEIVRNLPKMKSSAKWGIFFCETRSVFVVVLALMNILKKLLITFVWELKHNKWRNTLSRALSNIFHSYTSEIILNFKLSILNNLSSFKRIWKYLRDANLLGLK